MQGEGKPPSSFLAGLSSWSWQEPLRISEQGVERERARAVLGADLSDGNL